MHRDDAIAYAAKYQIPLGEDFHALGRDAVGRILDAANEHKYRRPVLANGSRARYFYYYLCRAARRA